MLADIKVPRGSAGGCMTHIWMTQTGRYRECLLKITFDNARSPSVLVPLGDFFGLGHGIVSEPGGVGQSTGTGCRSDELSVKRCLAMFADNAKTPRNRVPGV